MARTIRTPSVILSACKVAILVAPALAWSGQRRWLSQLLACYHDGMTKKVTTVRMPEELAEQVEVVARGRGISVNAVVLEALSAEIERVKADKDFMDRLRRLTERDKEILDRLAQ